MTTIHTPFVGGQITCARVTACLILAMALTSPAAVSSPEPVGAGLSAPATFVASVSLDKKRNGVKVSGTKTKKPGPGSRFISRVLGRKKSVSPTSTSVRPLANPLHGVYPAQTRTALAFGSVPMQVTGRPGGAPRGAIAGVGNSPFAVTRDAGGSLAAGRNGAIAAKGRSPRSGAAAVDGAADSPARRPRRTVRRAEPNGAPAYMAEIPANLQPRQKPRVAVRGGPTRKGHYQSAGELLASTGASDPSRPNAAYDQVPMRYDRVPVRVVYSALPPDAPGTDAASGRPRQGLGTRTRRTDNDAGDASGGSDMVIEGPGAGYPVASASRVAALPAMKVTRTRGPDSAAGLGPIAPAPLLPPPVPPAPAGVSGPGKKVRLGEVNRVGGRFPNLSPAWQPSLESFYISPR
ncbi:MAG: hypothetical protein ACJAQ3_002198 [Planctomycetota bacterium]|jgi:hypothetical protein